jgi:uncharacterized membrane protein YgdD (TMEM256/DUF423 family)
LSRHRRLQAALAALAGFVAVAAGAFGAHGVADARAKGLLATGAEYQLIHVVAALVSTFVSGRAARASGWLFVVGGALFSGSLYTLALAAAPWVGAVTPLGGVMFLAGWLTLAYAAWRQGDRL